VELVVCSNPAVVNATEDKTNIKLLRLNADIKEFLLVEVIAVLQPFNIDTKCLSCDTTADIAPFAELCSISKCRIFVVSWHMSIFGLWQVSAIFGVADRDGDRL